MVSLGAVVAILAFINMKLWPQVKEFVGKVMELITEVKSQKEKLQAVETKVAVADVKATAAKADATDAKTTATAAVITSAAAAAKTDTVEKVALGNAADIGAIQTAMPAPRTTARATDPPGTPPSGPKP